MPKNRTPLAIAIFTAGYTQGEFASVTGIDPTQLHRYVHGKHADEATRKIIVRQLKRTEPDLTEADLWPELGEQAA